ncbi:hypothetical protein [Methanolapillus millepedarum]|uniref:Nucleoid-associated protein n=1 Tax=Methanolapillus millepedarum TaxID=3028296 RepID=A0AA97A365_9EURY|nr:hypothetical protein MsAc7_02520 [Methanosarcinaceae archaeon Ac7]
MDVLHKSFYRVDVDGQKVSKRDTNDNFDEFISSLISFVSKDSHTRSYKEQDSNTQVIAAILKQIDLVFKSKHTPEDLEKECLSIAKRLLKIETDTQESIDKLGQKVRKGSLLSALLREGNTFTFILSKVNYTKFIDDDDLVAKLGFPEETQKIWKTAVFVISFEKNNISIKKISVYLDKAVKYWCNDFLEIDPLKTDESNTHEAFKGMQQILRKRIQPNSQSDYLHLSNSVVGYMRKGGLIDYPTMIDDIFERYIPINMEDKKYKDTVKALRNLPSDKKFDEQFYSIPDQVKKGMKKKYNVALGIELNILDQINLDIIESYQDNDGKKYIKIETTDDDTYEAFYKPKIMNEIDDL